MKITLTGSLGNIGKPLVKQLLENGHTVTVISSNFERKKEIETLGATAAIGSVEDTGFLTAAFADTDAVFLMIPPNFTVTDSRGYYQEVGQGYALAIQQTGVKRVVHLSSWGADLEQGTGYILGSHDVEIILNSIKGINTTHLRAGSFYYNLYAFIDMIKHTGMIGSNYGGEDKIVMVAPSDIADVAAEELTTHGSGHIRYVASDDIKASDAARILGKAIGKPELQWLTFSDEQTQSGLIQAGLPAPAAEKIVELGAAIHSGAMRKDYDLHQPKQMGKVKLNDFAKEFAVAFSQK